VLVAFVVFHGRTIAAQAVLDQLAERLVRYKLPAHVLPIEALPRTAVGKTDKPRLRALAREQIDRS
jgi:acyl-CoA synthetase (AMP-forming)/AMP-acid ligase II